MIERLMLIGILLSSLLLFVIHIRLARVALSRKGKKILGVCAGLSLASDMPLWLIRTFFLIFILFAGYGVFLYCLLWLVIDKKKIIPAV